MGWNQFGDFIDLDPDWKHCGYLVYPSLQINGQISLQYIFLFIFFCLSFFLTPFFFSSKFLWCILAWAHCGYLVYPPVQIAGQPAEQAAGPGGQTHQGRARPSQGKTSRCVGFRWHFPLRLLHLFPNSFLGKLRTNCTYERTNIFNLNRHLM